MMIKKIDCGYSGVWNGCGGVCKVVVVFARLWWCLEGCDGVWNGCGGVWNGFDGVWKVVVVCVRLWWCLE